jgi:hypothetical protein
MRKSLTESLIDTIELARDGRINVHPDFLQTDFAELLEICNACGAAGSKLPVPQTVYGLDIRPMCHPHDFEYHVGKTIADKEVADRRMRNNGHRVIRLRSGWLLAGLRRMRVHTYYVMVNNFGGEAFWDGKLED